MKCVHEPVLDLALRQGTHESKSIGCLSRREPWRAQWRRREIAHGPRESDISESRSSIYVHSSSAWVAERAKQIQGSLPGCQIDASCSRVTYPMPSKACSVLLMVVMMRVLNNDIDRFSSICAMTGWSSTDAASPRRRCVVGLGRTSRT